MSAISLPRATQLPSPRGRRPWRGVRISLVAACAVGCVAAAMIYRPWVNTPFDILDFSEFLPFLTRSDAFDQRFTDFVTYYASQGRLNLLSYVFLIWKWSLFGWNEAAWQIARFIQMQFIVVGVYLLLRALGASGTGSAAGAALYIVAQTATPAWIRLTMGEPLGVLAIICALLIATRYQETSRWRSAGAAIAALLTASLLAKEMLLPLVPFVLLLACSRNRRGHFERPQRTRRNVWLVALTTSGALAVLIPVAIVALGAGPGAYASAYAAGSISLGKFIYSLTVVVPPISASRVAAGSPVDYAANIVFFVVVAVSFRLAHRHNAFRLRWQTLALGAMSVVLIGVLVYLPWPNFQDFYGLPYLLGPAILLAIAITAIEEARPSWRWLVYAGCAIMLLQGAVYAAHEARAAIGARLVNGALVKEFVEHSSTDSIVVVMRRRMPAERAWQGRGRTLNRYARAILPGRRIPAVYEASCSAASSIRNQGVGNAMLVSYSTSCGTLPETSRTVRYDYFYLDWPTLVPRRDSLVVSIVGPEPGR